MTFKIFIQDTIQRKKFFAVWTATLLVSYPELQSTGWETMPRFEYSNVLDVLIHLPGHAVSECISQDSMEKLLMIIPCGKKILCWKRYDECLYISKFIFVIFTSIGLVGCFDFTS